MPESTQQDLAKLVCHSHGGTGNSSPDGCGHQELWRCLWSLAGSSVPALSSKTSFSVVQLVWLVGPECAFPKRVSLYSSTILGVFC